MEREKPRVVAVVVTYESAQSLTACIDALARQDVPVVVVDNVSRDASAAVARAAGACVIVNDRNEGYGRANNQGVRAADDADWCLIINPDAVPDADCVRLLLDGARRHPRAAILVPKLWHQAWSRSYVCRKHGVADDRIWILIRNGLKLLGVLPTFNRRSAAGAWAALRNKAAIERERLAPRVH